MSGSRSSRKASPLGDSVLRAASNISKDYSPLTAFAPSCWNQRRVSMLFRSLSLLLPVSLAFADTLVGHSDIDALKDVFKSAAGTMLEIQGACQKFADYVDIHHGTVGSVYLLPYLPPIV